jgi:hypothetical protein
VVCPHQPWLVHHFPPWYHSEFFWAMAAPPVSMLSMVAMVLYSTFTKLTGGIYLHDAHHTSSRYRP